MKFLWLIDRVKRKTRVAKVLKETTCANSCLLPFLNFQTFKAFDNCCVSPAVSTRIKDTRNTNPQGRRGGCGTGCLFVRERVDTTNVDRSSPTFPFFQRYEVQKCLSVQDAKQWNCIFRWRLKTIKRSMAQRLFLSSNSRITSERRGKNRRPANCRPIQTIPRFIRRRYCSQAQN